MIGDNEPFKQEGADFSDVTLNLRIKRRLDPVRKAYEDFLQQYPREVRARLAYGSFLSEAGDDELALEQWQKARDIDPKNPAAWNNLADHYGRHEQPDKAFDCLDQALALNAREPTYSRNLASMMFVHRAEAKSHYHLADEEAVLRRVLDLYRQARKSDPTDFELATTLAQVFYALEPGKDRAAQESPAARQARADEAIKAWNDARELARTDLDRQGIRIHLARVCLADQRYDAAREHLSGVTHDALLTIKKRLFQEIEAGTSANVVAPARPPPGPVDR